MVTHADLVDYHRLSFLAKEGKYTRLVADAAQAAGLVPVTIAGAASGPSAGAGHGWPGLIRPRWPGSRSAAGTG